LESGHEQNGDDDENEERSTTHALLIHSPVLHQYRLGRGPTKLGIMHMP
jgi:hypothetical protein